MAKKFSRAKLKKYRKLLEAKRVVLQKELDYLEKTTLKSTTLEASGDLSAYSYHMADQGTDAMEREKAFLFASREGRFLYHLNQAVLRIEDGTYGICHGCGELIDEERLDAVPHARLCLSCKSAEDRGEADTA